MCILSKQKQKIVSDGFLGKKMFDRDFVMSLSHTIATKYFPKKDDLIFYDREDAISLAKRVCICALQRGISLTKLEHFANKAKTAEAFNHAVSKYFGCLLEESSRASPYIKIYKNERQTLSKVFGLTDNEIEDLVWGRLSSFRMDLLYSKIEERAMFLSKKLGHEKNSADIVIKFLTIRWGMDDGFPKPIRRVASEMGISDSTNHKIKKLMNEIFDELLETTKRKNFN